MGVDDEVEVIEPLDLGMLLWPKRLLLIIYPVLIIWCIYRIMSIEMYEEEYVIRLIYMASLSALTGFIAISHRWAMSSAFTVHLCYSLAIFLLFEGRLWPLPLLFVGALTWKAVMNVEVIQQFYQARSVEVFE